MPSRREDVEGWWPVVTTGAACLSLPGRGRVTAVGGRVGVSRAGLISLFCQPRQLPLSEDPTRRPGGRHPCNLPGRDSRNVAVAVAGGRPTHQRSLKAGG